MQNKKKISLVTGGYGFIGSHMVDLLIKKGHEVRIIDNLSGGHKKNLSHFKNNKNIIFLKKDISKLKNNEKIFNKVDYVFHFAGKGDIVPSIENPSDYIKTNVLGTERVLENIRKKKIKKLVYAASSSCYGLAKVPTSETHKIDTLYPYALSKYLGEQLSLHYQNVYKTPVNSIRIFNAYGPRVRTTGVYGAVFGVFFKQVLSKKPLTIVGNGNQKRDFLFVTDVCEAFYKAAITNYTGEIYNLGAGNPTKVIKLAKLLSNNFIYLPKRPGEPNCTWANISKIKKQLSWKPKVDFEKGVKIMLKDIYEWKDAPLWNKNNIKKATKTWFKFMSKTK